ncbi:hypothetical protein V6Z12_A05G447300 [Gossypium hirsutum]
MLFYLIKTCFYNFCFEKKTNILTFVLRKILNALWLPVSHALPSLFSRKASTQAFHSQPAKARRRCVLGVTPVRGDVKRAFMGVDARTRGSCSVCRRTWWREAATVSFWGCLGSRVRFIFELIIGFDVFVIFGFFCNF